jgi:hypothetical protein
MPASLASIGVSLEGFQSFIHVPRGLRDQDFSEASVINAQTENSDRVDWNLIS